MGIVADDSILSGLVGSLRAPLHWVGIMKLRLLAITSLIVAFTVPLRAQAQGSAIPEANDAIIQACRDAGGTVQDLSAGSCQFVKCKYSSDSSTADRYYRRGDNSRSTCSDSELRTAIETERRRLDNITTELDRDTRPVEDQRDSSRDGTYTGDPGGRTSSSARGGGRADSGEESFYVASTSTTLRRGDRCYSECKPYRAILGLIGSHREGLDRSSCRRCLQREYGVDVTASGGRGRSGGAGVTIRGVDLDLNRGRTTTVIRRGDGDGDGRRTVVRRGDVDGDGGDYVTIRIDGETHSVPARCVRNGELLSSCRHLITSQSSDRGRCEYSRGDRGCIGDDEYYRISERHARGSDCPDCPRGNQGPSVGAVLAATVPGALAGAFGSWMNYRGVSRMASAYENATIGTAEQCRLAQQQVLDYTTQNEGQIITPDQLNCNGFGAGQFAGLGGGLYGNAYGGFGNPYLGAGYSGGFLNGMAGPYGLGGLGGGLGGGVQIGGGIGGFPGGIGGIGGLQGGYYGGGLQGGIQGGYYGGGIGGFPGGIGGLQGGFGGLGGGINIGIGGGLQGGIGGLQGGYYGGGLQGGIQGGYFGGGLQGGIQGGYYGGGIGGGIGGFPGGIGGIGGYGSGTVPWGGQQGSYWGNTGAYGGGGSSIYQNQQAASLDARFQGQAVASQFGTAAQNYGMYGGGAFGAAAFSPMNIGAQFNAGVNFGGGIFP